MPGTIVDHIIEIKDSLPKKQKQLCNYIVLHSGEAGMMTVAELAQQAGVGTTTVMRLVQYLGYDSYNCLKRDTQLPALFGDLFPKLFPIHLCCPGNPHFLEFLFVCRCFGYGFRP